MLILRKTDKFELCVHGNRTFVQCRVKGATPRRVNLSNKRFLQLRDNEASDREFDATVVLEIGCGLYGRTK